MKSGSIYEAAAVEAFERWLEGTSGWKACKKRGKPMSLRRHMDGSYADFRVNDRWLAWRAALAARLAQQPARGEAYPAAQTFRDLADMIDKPAETLRRIADELPAQPRTEQPAAERPSEVVGEVCERAPCSYSKVVLFDSDLPPGTKLYAATPPRADAEVDDAMVERGAKALATKWLHDTGSKLSLELAEQLASAALTAAINQGEKS